MRKRRLSQVKMPAAETACHNVSRITQTKALVASYIIEVAQLHRVGREMSWGDQQLLREEADASG